MKLLYITNGISGSGGLERVISIKATFLADHYGYDVSILSLNESHVDTFYEFSNKIEMLSIPVKGNLLQYMKNYAKGLNTIVNSVKPDIISVCDDGLKGFVVPKIIGNKIPIIYERHVSKSIELRFEQGFFHKLIVKLKWKIMDSLASSFSKFILLTRDNVKEWDKLRNIEVIPNPLSFYPNKSSLLTSRQVIAVGKQSYQKGYDLLLQAWYCALKSYPSWQLNIYGKKNENKNKKLTSLAKDLNITKSVSFFDPVCNIEDKYLDSSIFVLSSRFEGFGMVLIEAMACGLPCVSFDCPHGPADIIRNGEDGILVPNGDEQKLAEAIELLINDKELRLRMGAKAKHNVKKYLPENIVKQWHDLFSSLAKNE